jgi:hypothetical protein
MNQERPNLKAAEKRRSNYIGLVLMFSFFVALCIGVYLQTIIGVVIAIAVSSVLAWKLIELVYSKINVSCPICGSINLTENYANTTRYSDTNV